MKARIRTEQFNGKTIYITDLSGLRGNEYIKTVEEALKRDSGVPDGSLVICNIENTFLTDNEKKEAKKMSELAKKKKFKVSLLGITGIKAIIANTLNRDTYFAKDMDAAKNWLTK